MTTNFGLGFLAKGDEVVVIVLGTRTTKVAAVRRDGPVLTLQDYLLLDAPVYEKGFSKELLTAHLTKLRAELGSEINRAILVTGMANAVIRTLEVPLLTPLQMPRMLRQSANHFFQQDLKDYDFACHVLANVATESKGPEAATSQKKQRVLVSGVKGSYVEDLQAAAKEAGLIPIEIVLSQGALFNAAMLVAPEVLKAETIALVDLGFQTSTISFSLNGEMGLTRVVPLGGHNFTNSLAEAFGIPYQVAEGIKTVMPDKVQAKLQDCLAPLAHELKAAIDFFESQQERKVSQVWVSGGTARSDLIVQGLQDQLGVPCQRWDPTSQIKLALPPPKDEVIPKDVPQLTTALGAAAAWARPELIQMNLLAERLEAERLRRRDPFKRAVLPAVVVVLLVLAWAGQVRLELWMADSELSKCNTELGVSQPAVSAVAADSEKIGRIEENLRALSVLATNRFYWVQPLNALQYVMVDDIQVVKMQVQRKVTQSTAPDAAATGAEDKPAKISGPRETVTLIIRAKNTGPPGTTDKFIEAISSEPYFATHLRKDNPVILRERLPPQIDPLNPTRNFILFTIECFFAERQL